MAKLIPLTHGLTAIIDDEDFERVRDITWRAKWNKCTQSWYAVAWSPAVNGKRYHITLHRQILGLKRGDRREADHIKSGDTLDNRRHNLRIATKSENCCNNRKRADNTSGFKGVCWNIASKKWVARIQVKGRRKNILFTKDKIEAAHAYDKAALKYHGAFAVLNFPQENQTTISDKSEQVIVIDRRTICRNTSGYRGVSWSGKEKKWVVQIKTKRKGKRLGCFAKNQLIEAARAYDRAALHYFGEFARLNFPREDYVAMGKGEK